jgi:hypothetical protein
MSRRPTAIPFALLIALTALASPRAAADGFDQGVEAFEKKDYAAARDHFVSVIESEQRISADLLFNLGNTLFRLDDPGAAALWYRRGLLLAPTDAALRQNLRLVGRLTGFLEFGSEIRGSFPWLARGAIAAGWLAAICLAAVVFLRPERRARAWLWAGFGVFAVVAGAAVAVLWKRVSPDELARRAVVTRDEVAALAAPTPTAGVIMDLPAGSEVSVREARETWSYVEIPGDPARVGWVRREALTPLWPYPRELIR